MRYVWHFFDIVVACRRVIRGLILLATMWSCLISPRGAASYVSVVEQMEPCKLHVIDSDGGT